MFYPHLIWNGNNWKFTPRNCNVELLHCKVSVKRKEIDKMGEQAPKITPEGRPLPFNRTAMWLVEKNGEKVAKKTKGQIDFFKTAMRLLPCLIRIWEKFDKHLCRWELVNYGDGGIKYWWYMPLVHNEYIWVYNTIYGVCGVYGSIYGIYGALRVYMSICILCTMSQGGRSCASAQAALDEKFGLGRKF